MSTLYTSDVVAALPPAPDRRAGAIIAGAAVGLAMMGLGVYVLGVYGAVLFLLTPFAMGLTASYILHRGADVDRARMARVIIAMMGATGGVLLMFALEGLICLMMAFPLAFPFALIGGEFGIYLATRGPSGVLLGLLILPATAGIEATQPPDRVDRVVLSAIEIDAPPDRVWEHILVFPPLPEPTDWWFRAGLAYPKHATLEGRGVGAVRYCVFSTGPFVEPITAWEPGRRLAFDVVESPAPLRELTPWSDVHPPHMDGYFRASRGEFRLIALEGGRTRLEGRTWYELDLAPAWYWEWIADTVVHGIHEQVLEHIKREAESATHRMEGATS